MFHRVTGLFVLLAATFVGFGAVAKELSAEDKRILREFKDQLESLETQPNPRLKQDEPENLYLVTTSLLCPIHPRLV